ELRIVGKRRVVADHAIMRDVHISEKQIALADRGLPAILRGADMNGDELANDIVVADHEPRGLAAVFAILRNLADGRELKDAIARADLRAAGQHHVRTDHGPRADRDLGTDNRERAYFDIVCKLCTGIDQSRRMNARHLGSATSEFPLQPVEFAARNAASNSAS